MKAIPALDRTDLRLLALLQRDGRASNADLAAQVNLSPSACLRRIQRLEASGVVAGYAARLDPQALGLGLQAFVRVQLEKHGAAGIERFGGVSRWVGRHHRPIQIFGGVMLILVGLLLLTGVWEDLTRWLQAELVSGFTVPI